MIVGAELGIRHVAYVELAGPREHRVWIRNIRTGATRLLYRARSGGANDADVTRPTYLARPEAFVWARTNLGSGAGNRIIRYTLSGSRLAYAQGSPRYNSTAWANATLGVATASSLDGSESPGACSDAGVRYCKVELTGPLQFNLRP